MVLFTTGKTPNSSAKIKEKTALVHYEVRTKHFIVFTLRVMSPEGIISNKMYREGGGLARVLVKPMYCVL